MHAFIDTRAAFNFRTPPGAPALFAPESVTWRVYKNPVTLFVGGVAAVILELAEPRVRTGVWEHTSFRSDPVGRMKRTGHAAMMSVYGPRGAAEMMIAGVKRMHVRVSGVTPCGRPYRADDPALLGWVRATASFGFISAHHRYARRLSAAERDAFWGEGAETAALWGAADAPRSEAAWNALLGATAPKLERHAIVHAFLDLMNRAPVAPAPLRPLQRLLVRAAVALTPPQVRETLGLNARLSRRGEALVAMLAAAADRAPIPAAPQVQACERLGLPGDYLYRDP